MEHKTFCVLIVSSQINCSFAIFMRYRANDEIFTDQSPIYQPAHVKTLWLKWNVLITVLWTIIFKLYKVLALLLYFFHSPAIRGREEILAYD